MATALGTCLGAAPVAAQAAKPSADSQNWASICSTETRGGALDCSLSQRVIDAKTGRLIAMVRIRFPSDTRAPVMLLQMPLGVYLPAGLSLAVDNASQGKAEFQTCEPDGCYAGMPLAGTLLKAMLKGQTLNITIQDQAHNDTTLRISLAGFSKTYEDIK